MHTSKMSRHFRDTESNANLAKMLPLRQKYFYTASERELSEYEDLWVSFFVLIMVQPCQS